jgi:PPE-repeat protein
MPRYPQMFKSTLGSNTFVSLDNFVTKSGGQVSVANNEVTLTIPTGGDSGMQIGNLAGFGISSSLGYADNDLAKISFEAKVVTNASGFGNTVRFKDNQGNVITNTDITLTTEYQTFTNYYVLTTVSGYRIPLLYRNGNRTGEDVQKFRNFSIEKV